MRGRRPPHHCARSPRGGRHVVGFPPQDLPALSESGLPVIMEVPKGLFRRIILPRASLNSCGVGVSLSVPAMSSTGAAQEDLSFASPAQSCSPHICSTGYLGAGFMAGGIYPGFGTFFVAGKGGGVFLVPDGATCWDSAGTPSTRVFSKRPWSSREWETWFVACGLSAEPTLKLFFVSMIGGLFDGRSHWTLSQRPGDWYTAMHVPLTWLVRPPPAGELVGCFTRLLRPFFVKLLTDLADGARAPPGSSAGRLRSRFF